MPKWEYCQLHAYLEEKDWVFEYEGKLYAYENLVQIMNIMGQQGWELVSISSNINSKKALYNDEMLTYSDSESFYFKREIA